MISSEELPEFLRAHGLSEHWNLRFTTDARRAFEMAGVYRNAGFSVAILPFSSVIDEDDCIEESVDPETSTEDGCLACLEDAYAVLTKGGPQTEGVPPRQHEEH